MLQPQLHADQPLIDQIRSDILLPPHPYSHAATRQRLHLRSCTDLQPQPEHSGCS